MAKIVFYAKCYNLIAYIGCYIRTVLQFSVHTGPSWAQLLSGIYMCSIGLHHMLNPLQTLTRINAITLKCHSSCGTFSEVRWSVDIVKARYYEMLTMMPIKQKSIAGLIFTFQHYILDTVLRYLSVNKSTLIFSYVQRNLMYCKTLIFRVTLFSRAHDFGFIHETLFS